MLRKHLGPVHSPISSQPPPVSDDSIILPQPEAVLDRRVIQKGKYRPKSDVLIKWKGAPREDATWENEWRFTKSYLDYLNPFHAYDEGNLSWMAAAEAEPATMSMVRRAIPNASSLEEGNRVLRGNWLKTIEQHHQQYSGKSIISDILDVGCSVGVSTRFLADKFPLAKVTGLDLSPHFLSVAQFKEKKGAPRKNPINWIHANGEDTGLPSKSYDLVTIAFVVHECPERAINGLLREAYRLLRPGGTIALTDSSPKSKILQELSPVLFTLMKSTEPFLDEYYLTDLEVRLKETGFLNIQSVLTDPRHMTITATVPQSR
eukprot:XP_015578398.1 uncharacterized protein LOC107261730 [Ricinus communis]